MKKKGEFNVLPIPRHWNFEDFLRSTRGVDESLRLHVYRGEKKKGGDTLPIDRSTTSHLFTTKSHHHHHRLQPPPSPSPLCIKHRRSHEKKEQTYLTCSFTVVSYFRIFSWQLQRTYIYIWPWSEQTIAHFSYFISRHSPRFHVIYHVIFHCFRFMDAAQSHPKR